MKTIIWIIIAVYVAITVLMGLVQAIIFKARGDDVSWGALLLLPLLMPIVGICWIFGYEFTGNGFIAWTFYKIEDKILRRKIKKMQEKNNESKFKVYKIDNLRVDTDGNGVCSLVVLNKCPLNCKYCLNPKAKGGDDFTYMSPELLYKMLMPNDLYFVVSGGGVTFGGGEPLLQSDKIKEFKKMCPEKWTINVETSLNVPLENVEELAEVVDKWFIDIKDMNPEIYKKYTGHSNEKVIENLKWMVRNGLVHKMCIRIPFIPEYNSIEDVEASQRTLNKMGLTEYDIFHYITKEKLPTIIEPLMGCPIEG